jgi:hypothetical protein
VWELLEDDRTPRSDWSISRILAIELAAYLERVRPKRILEVGSGFSTAVLAAYAVGHDAEVVTLEHQREFHKHTRRGLAKLGLDGPVDLKLADLRPQRFGGHRWYQWYEVSLEKEFDFVFVDGPPKEMGRRGVFYAIREHLTPGWQIWLDDGLRRHEHQCIKLWEQEFPGEFFWDRIDIDGKGIFRLCDATDEAERGAEQAHAGRLAIGVVVNGDPNWWRRAKRTVGDRLLDSSYVVVTTRGGPLPSRPKFVNRPVPADGRPLEQRVQAMLKELADQPGVRYVLYLDDQWSPRTLDARWLSRALDVLETRADIEQVCLEHRADAGGEANGQGLARPFTGVPSLLRADRLKEAFSSADAKSRRRRRTGRSGSEVGSPPELLTVELSPGVFCRINGNGHR